VKSGPPARSVADQITHDMQWGATPIATFLGGCVAASADEEALAFRAGRRLGELGFAFQHGGYNGLMEHAARGAAESDARVVAVTLRGKEEWGAFNPYVTETIYARDMGARLAQLIGRAHVIVAAGGGVGTLHELTAALWYAGNIRPVPVVLLGPTADRLACFLHQEKWLYESPTRPLDFLHSALTESALNNLLGDIGSARRPAHVSDDSSLLRRLRQTASADGPYRLQSGGVLSTYFDPFRIASDPVLSAELADAMAARVNAQTDVVVGVELGGVILAANLAAALERPMLVVRTRPKLYGTAAQIEGVIKRGQRAIIVDDVVRTGQNVLRVNRLLADAGMTVRQAMCVTERPGEARSALRAHGIALAAILIDQGGGQGDADCAIERDEMASDVDPLRA
jgi:uncharacterized protein (TIGR00725 family)